MSDSDDGEKTWEPRRGRVFKIVAWVLLVLSAVGALAGVVFGLVL